MHAAMRRDGRAQRRHRAPAHVLPSLLGPGAVPLDNEAETTCWAVATQTRHNHRLATKGRSSQVPASRHKQQRAKQQRKLT